MKRKFVLLAILMCILGGFNLSNLNAQTTVTIGNGSSKSTAIPFDLYNGTGVCQILYTSSELNTNGKAVINSFALNYYGEVDNASSSTLLQNPNVTGKFKVYLQNTDIKKLEDFVPVTEGPSFDGEKTFNNDSWITFDFTSPFSYNGGNLIVTFVDYTGSRGGNFYAFYVDEIQGYCISSSSSFSPTYMSDLADYGLRPRSQFVVTTGSQPLSLTASAVKTTIYDNETVQLTAVAKGGSEEYTYSWSPATGLDNATSATPIFTPSATGEYTFTCTVNDGETTETASVTVTVEEAPVETVIGQTGGDYSVLPGYNYYNYSISQQIYTSDDLSDLGKGFKINSISFMPARVNQPARNWSVYLINTTKEQFDSTTGFIALSESDRLYTGDVNFVENEWTTINFTTPFIYEGNNILVCVKDNKGNYTYGSNNQYYSIASNGKLLSVLNYNDYNSYNVSNVSNYTNYETTGVRSAIKLEYEEVALQLSLTVSTDKEYIPTDGSVQLTAKAKGGTGNYTYSWSPVTGLSNTTSATTTFTPSAAGTYTFTCTVDDGETTATDDVTITVYEKPNLAKQYRIKVSTDSHAKYGQYFHINSTATPGDNTNVIANTYTESNNQIFTLEDAGNGNYYLRSADGYYIKCGTESLGKAWNVYAYSTTVKTPIFFDYVDGSNFYLRDSDKSGNNYFKVEGANVYCDADINGYNANSGIKQTVTWTLEEAVVAEPEKPSAPTNLTANASSYNTIDLSWNAAAGATSYNIYLNGSNSKIDSVNGTSFQVTGLVGEKEYCFTVTAVNIVGESDPSEEECATTPAEPVGCKVIFELKAAGTFGWGSSGMFVVYYTGGPENGDNLTLSSGTSETYTYTWAPGTKLTVYLFTSLYPAEMGYTIKYANGVVIAEKEIGEISSSDNYSSPLYLYEIDCSELPVPTVNAVAVGKSAIKLTWDNLGGASGYNVYDREGDLIVGNITGTTTTVYDLSASTEYCFTVTAIFDEEESEHSNLACATTSDSDTNSGTIGNGDNQGTNIPIEVSSPYSYSQQSYTRDEITAAGGSNGYITSIAYDVNTITANATRSLKIFMSNTENLFTFVSDATTYKSNNYPLNGDNDLVFDGEVTFTTTGWIEIPFTTPFFYNGNHIVVTVIDNTGNSSDGFAWFNATATYGNDANGNWLYYASNSSSDSPISSAELSGWTSINRNNIKLTFTSPYADIVFDGNGDWNNTANWNLRRLPAENEEITITGNAVITNDVTINSITIDGGSLTVEANNSLTINGNMTNDDASAFVIEDSAQVFQTNDDVMATFRMNIKAPTAWNEKNITGWQFISSPMKDAATASFVPNDHDYDLFKYVGGVELEWVNYKNVDNDFEGKFKQGSGYMASYKVEGYAEFAGVLNNETSFKYQNFNALNDADYFANFYLLGNPFSFDMKWDNIEATDLAEGYAVVTTDGGYEYSTSNDIKVGDGFFVKVTGTNPSLSYTANTRNRNVDENKYINLIASNKAGNDNVIINFADNGRDGFSKLENFNEDIAEIYVKENEKRYGILNYDEDIEEIDVYFNAKKIGYYTINAISNADFSNVTLIDRLTGIETNILTDSYTFQATAKDSPERFIIRINKETESENFVYKSGEELIINAKGCVQIIDVMGRIVYSNDIVNDNHRINISSLKNATYIVRVVNTNEVKTQKIVIW